MNAVVDEDLPRSFSALLSSLGFTVFDPRDNQLRGASDDVFFQFAQKKHAVLFSADLGFSNIVQFPPGTHEGIVIIRFQNELKTMTVNQEAGRLLRKLLMQDYSGNLVIVSPGKIRIRRFKTKVK